jgi:hypothetical protein
VGPRAGVDVLVNKIVDRTARDVDTVLNDPGSSGRGTKGATRQTYFSLPSPAIVNELKYNSLHYVFLLWC